MKTINPQMKRFFLLTLLVLLSSVTLSAQNANVKYTGNAQPGDKVYSCGYDGYVNIRQTASYNAAKLGKFENGSTGAVLVQNLGEWIQIDNNGTIGYVPSRFVQDEPTEAYTGNATVSDIAGLWNVLGAFNIISIYENGYWRAFGNYFPIAYGYYIMQNNEIKLIAIEKVDPEHRFEDGNLIYHTVREVYATIDIDSLNNNTRVEFLTGNEAEEDLEGIDPYYCTQAQFKEEAKIAEQRVKDIINNTDIQLQELVENSEESAEESVADEVVESVDASDVDEVIEEVAETVVEPVEVLDVNELAEQVEEGPTFFENVKYNILDFLYSGQAFSVIRIILIIIVGLLALGLLFFLVVLFVRYLPSIIAWTKESFATTASSSKSVNANKQLDNADITNNTTPSSESNQLPVQTKDKNLKLSVLQWLLIIGVYIMIFWDIALGFLMLFAIGVYKIAQQLAPTQVESLLASCKENLQQLKSQPMLFMGLLSLIAGHLMFRIVGPFIGSSVILLSSVFLVCIVFAPSVCEKVVATFREVVANIKPLWGNTWVKIGCIGCFIILTLGMEKEQESIYSLLPDGSDLLEYYDDYSYDDSYDDTADYDNYQEDDYSWVYGTWQMTIDGETHTICFLDNGVYTEHFRGHLGSNSDSGTYTIQSGRIKCDCGDGYPSYIYIEGKRLTSNGEYYRKK